MTTYHAHSDHTVWICRLHCPLWWHLNCLVFHVLSCKLEKSGDGPKPAGSTPSTGGLFPKHWKRRRSYFQSRCRFHNWCGQAWVLGSSPPPAPNTWEKVAAKAPHPGAHQGLDHLTLFSSLQSKACGIEKWHALWEKSRQVRLSVWGREGR